jgi:hypothetical protein
VEGTNVLHRADVEQSFHDALAEIVWGYDSLDL